MRLVHGFQRSVYTIVGAIFEAAVSKRVGHSVSGCIVYIVRRWDDSTQIIGAGCVSLFSLFSLYEVFPQPPESGWRDLMEMFLPHTFGTFLLLHYTPHMRAVGYLGMESQLININLCNCLF